MLRLIIVLLVGALGWMVWWTLGQGAYEQGLAVWVQDRRGDGWVAEYDTLQTRGFPNRFDTTVTDLRLADPETGIAWAVPQVQLLSLAYKPHQVIAVMAQSHRFSTPFETLEISHSDMRASLFLKPETALGLQEVRVIVEDLFIEANRGWQAGLASGRFAVESVATVENTYRIGVEASDLVPSQPVRRQLDPAGVLPPSIEALRLDATMRFDRAWDRFAIEDARPQPRNLDLTDLSATWGSVTFRAAGSVEIDAAGVPAGDMTLRAVEWRKLLEMAVNTGVIAQAFAGPLESGLELLSGPRDVLDVTLTFKNGRTQIGPIPIGPAPRIQLR